MMPAKLFAGATLALVATLIVARLWIGTPLDAPAADIYIPDVYFVAAGRRFLLQGILICAASAIVYYACARWLNLSLNRTLVLLHFECVMFAMLALFWEVLVARRAIEKAIEAMAPAQDTWDVGTNVVVPVLALLLGFALFGVNIIWALIVRLRKS